MQVMIQVPQSVGAGLAESTCCLAITNYDSYDDDDRAHRLSWLSRVFSTAPGRASASSSSSTSPSDDPDAAEG